MSFNVFLPYLAVMAIVTYLVRAVPLIAINKKIENKFILSFLHYMPYSVLSVMTVPAVFFATQNIISAAAGVAAALILAYFKKGLMTVALGASGAVLIAELIIKYII